MILDKNIKIIFFDAGSVLFTGRVDWEKEWKEKITRILASSKIDKNLIQKALEQGDKYEEEYFKKHPWIYNWEEEREFRIGYYETLANELEATTKELRDKLFLLTFDIHHYSLYPEVIEVLETLQCRYRLGVISNALPSLEWAFDLHDIRKYFNDITISAKEGIAKPDKEIYLSAIKKMNYLPEESIFIDDQIKNVQTARELGMKGIHLDRNKDDLKSILGLD